jgi:ketosteroid isomerase-like protein
MEQRVKDFFLQYERANTSSDVLAISSLYADTFMFGGPKGVQAIKKEDFLKVIPKMKAHFSAMGLSETHLQTVEATSIDSNFLLAKAAWKMTIQSSGGGKYVDAFATYILAQSQAEALCIVFQIDHQDLATVIRNQQNHAE